MTEFRERQMRFCYCFFNGVFYSQLVTSEAFNGVFQSQMITTEKTLTGMLRITENTNPMDGFVGSASFFFKCVNVFTQT